MLDNFLEVPYRSENCFGRKTKSKEIELLISMENSDKIDTMPKVLKH